MNISNKSKAIKYIIGVLLLSGLIYYMNVRSTKQEVIRKQQYLEQQQEAYTKWQQELAKRYNDGIWYISKYNYKAAKETLSCFYKGEHNAFKDAQILAIFATAKEWENAPYINYRTAYDFASSELKKIPKDYNGQFAVEINIFRDKVQGRLDNYASADKEARKEKDSHIYVGDSEYKVLEVMGEPRKKNRTAVGNTVREQWVYNGKYIYIQDGTVVSWQD